LDFLKFVGTLLVSDFAVIFIFSFWVVLLAAVTFPFTWASASLAKYNRPLALIVASPAILLMFVVQAYFWLAWAAWCAVVARGYAETAYVPLLYYLTAFTFCTGPIGYMMHKELQTLRPDEAASGSKIVNGSAMYGTVAVLGYLAFVIWPNLERFAFSPFAP
jgi:hypothetical protein